ncbi:16S rRNA (uracil(1498)-N(3))-methyltransferase [uncultured Actinomyces sp.]|uniref:16S rRNA (uracil(1498)-N(3))-methyltransferase n=1 Tax=uncultured Actinomyces sp. TaxID=249061 RepID=UPI00262511B9|nr:16S rRNA (uracil(1498)-N(3))-methyltransferase [uncultured Actinomyces sp.]
MSAPVFVLTPDTLEPAGGAQTARRGGTLTLTGPEAHHAVAVRRLRVGERVDLVDGAGLRLVCEVAEGGRPDRLGVRVVERVVETPPPLRLALVQALAKGGRDEQAVQTATEVGVEVVVPWQAERCVSVWRGPRAVRGRDRWQATAREAAKQARRARVPQVDRVRTTRDLAGWTGEVVAAGGLVLVLHEAATAPLGGVDLPRPGPPRPVVAVVVGPEGGVSEAETTALRDAGALVVRLGPHVLRTASAGPVALAVLAQRAGLWS